MQALFDAIPGPVVDLCRRLRAHNKRGWVVGGCVRDLLRGAPAKDWDVATDARPEEVQRIFERVIPTGIQHGTVTVLLRGVPYEVTTLRGDGAYADGRRPEAVTFLDDITEDLARRDFTINAVALEPLERHIVDPFGGREDLANRVLRAVGEPSRRFQEDGLRILRGARFAATLAFSVERRTLSAMGERASLDTLARVSSERIHDEWLKAMGAETPSIAFSIMEATLALDVCCPELRATVGCREPCGLDVWTHSLGCVDRCPPDPVLRMAALLHDVAKPRCRVEADGVVTFPEHDAEGAKIVDGILRRLKFSNDDRQRVVELVQRHVVGYEPDWSDADVRRWMRKVTSKRLDDQLALAAANAASRGGDDATEREGIAELAARVERERARGAVMTAGDLALRGKELIAGLALSPGPIVGELLGALVEAVTDDPAVNEPRALLEHARRILAARDGDATVDQNEAAP